MFNFRQMAEDQAQAKKEADALERLVTAINDTLYGFGDSPVSGDTANLYTIKRQTEVLAELLEYGN